MTDRRKVPVLNSLQKDIFEILQYKFKSSKVPFEQKIIDFQKNYNQYSTVDLSTFANQINEIPIKETLIQIGFNVPFDLNIIKLLNQYLLLNRSSISDIVAFESLIQGLSYLVSDEKPEEAFVALLNILTQLLALPQYQNKIISVYDLILKEFSTSHQNKITDNIHSAITTFLTFFISNSKLLPETFSESFFLYMMKISTYEKITKICDLFDLIDQFIKMNKLFFSVTDNQAFFDIISPFISKLNFSAIKLLMSIAQINNDCIPSILTLFEIMADGLNKEIIQSESSIKTVFIEQDLTDFPALRDFNEIKYEMTFKNLPKFEYNESDVTNLFAFQDQFQISLNFTPIHIQNYLTIISNKMIGISEKYIFGFLSQIMKSAKQLNHLLFYADFFSVIVFFANNCEASLDDSIIQFLMSSIIFHSSKFSSFVVDTEDPCYYYHYLRYAVFSLMMRQENSKYGLIKVLLTFAAKMSPLIYSELLLYLLMNLKSFDKLTNFCTEKQLQSFMNVSIELQDLYSNQDTKMNDSCRLARNICLDFYFTLINDPESLPVIASTQNFSKGMVNFLFEQSLSNLVLDQISNAFSKIRISLNNPPFSPLIPFFTNVLDCCANKVNESSYKELGTSIINNVFKMIRANSNFIVVFYPNLFYLLKFFKATNEVAFLNEIFNAFFVALKNLPDIEIKFDTFDIIVNYLNSILVEKNEMINKLQLLFLTLLAGKEINSFDQMFIIKYHQVIPFFIASFSKYQYFDEIISFFFKICQYSPSNYVACHDGDLDYFLIYFLRKESEFIYQGHHIKFTFDIDQNYELIFNFFSQIIRIKTSAFICNQLFQMLIPSSPFYQVNDVEKNLYLIFKVINENLSQMKPIFNLVTNKTLCNITGVTDKHMNDDFAFSFWIKVDVPQIHEIPDEYTIAIIKDNGSTQYKIYLKSNFLNVKISNSKGEKGNQKKKEFISNEWTLVTFIQQKIDNEFIMKIYINNVSIEQINTTNFQFHQGNVSITFGTSVASSDKYANIKIGELGPFCFSKTINLTAVNMDKNFEHLSNMYFSSAKKINPQLQSNFDIVNLKDIENKSNLNSILIEYYDLNYLTYVFSKFQVDDSKLLFLFLKIILSLLSSSQVAQHNYRSVSFLAQTISKLFGRKLNYDIFLEIYLAFEKLTNQKRIIEFFDNLIFNMNIWCLADTSSVISIIQHLNRNSNGQFYSLFQHSCNISRLLSIYRLSFFPNKLEKSEDQSLYSFKYYHIPKEINAIKKEFFKFMVEIGKSSLNYQDVQTIYSHLFASQDKMEKIDILTLLSHLDQIIPNIKNIHFDLISPLFKLLLSNDIEIIVNTIMTIKSISFQFCHLYFSIISVPMSEDPSIWVLFDILLNNVSKNVDLYSLICALALLKGKKKIIVAVNLLEKLCSSDCEEEPILDDSYMWAVWPICIALNGPRSQRKVVARFLCKQITRKTVAKNLINNFINIYCLIEYLSQHNKTVSYYTQSEFTFQVMESIFTTSNADIEGHKINFLVFAFSSIFFHTQYFRNRPLNNLLNQSPFLEEKHSHRHQHSSNEGNNNENSYNENTKNNDNDIDISIDNLNENKDENNGKKRFKNFDDFYFTWRDPNTVKGIVLNVKTAHDYSGFRTESSINVNEKSKPQSEGVTHISIKKPLLLGNKRQVNKEEEEKEEEELKKEEGIGTKKPCKSFSQLLNFVHPPSLKQKNLMFQMKIADNEEWVDSVLCDRLVEHSNENLNQISHDSVEYNLITNFILIADYLKKRSLENNDEILLLPKNKKSLIQSLEDAVVSIQSKLKARFDPDNVFELLKKALDRARDVQSYDNSDLFNSVHEVYIKDFQFEIKKINDFRIELRDIEHYIQKSFVRCRDSSVFLDKNTNKRKSHVETNNQNNNNNKNCNNKVNSDNDNDNINQKDSNVSQNNENVSKNNDNANQNNANQNNSNQNNSNQNNANQNNANQNNANQNNANQNNANQNSNVNIKINDINSNIGNSVEEFIHDACIDEINENFDNIVYDNVYKVFYKDRDFFYKRDNCLCNGFCPIKLRPKYMNENREVNLLNEDKIFKTVLDIELKQPDDDDDLSISEIKEEEEGFINDSEYNCRIIKISHEIPTKLCFLKDQIILMSLSTTKIIVIPFKLIRHIYRRKRYQMDRAVEIVLINGKSYFIDFEKKKKSRLFFNKIQNLSFPLAKTVILESPINSMEKNKKITLMWENGVISNFSYILTLNMISGRSFNDVTQYPIFPLILQSNTSNEAETSDDLKESKETKSNETKASNEDKETKSSNENSLNSNETNEVKSNDAQTSNENENSLKSNDAQTSNENENSLNSNETNEVKSNDAQTSNENENSLNSNETNEVKSNDVQTSNENENSLNSSDANSLNENDSPYVIEVHLNEPEFVVVSDSQIVTDLDSLIANSDASGSQLSLINESHQFPEPHEKSTILLRDLSKSIVLSTNDHLTSLYTENINIEIDSMFNTSPLPPDVVDRFMLRLEPFTSLHLRNQNWHFTSKSIMHSVEQLHNEKSELIPEFYFFPEFLMNMNELPIDHENFTFPKFKQTTQNAFEFIYRHRKLLETTKISQSLNKWIDQIWGFKQHEFNYHPDIFENIWELKSSSLTTAEEKIVSMMRLYGLMPPRLFNIPHAKRTGKLDLSSIHAVHSAQCNNQKQLQHQQLRSPLLAHLRSSSSQSIMYDMSWQPSSLPYRQTRHPSPPLQIKASDAPCQLTSSSSSFMFSELTANEDGDDQTTKFGSIENSICIENSEHESAIDELLFDRKEVVRHSMNSDAMVRFACPIGRNSFFFIDMDGNAFEVQVLMNKVAKRKKQIDKEIGKCVTHLSSIENGFVMVSTFNDRICIQGNILTSYLVNMNQDINMIVGSQNYFLTIQNHSILTLFDTASTESDGRIVSIESPIVDCTLDQSFGLIVFLTSNSILHIHSIHNMQKVNSIDLNGFYPKKLLITCKWGFIVVHCLNAILVFDVNGFLIKKVEFKYSIVYWSSIRSYKDFDFVVFESDKQEIGMFEAFNPLQTLTMLTQVDSPVVSIDFFREQDCIAILTKKGEVVVISNIFPHH